LAAAWVALAQRQNVRAYALVGLLIGLGALVRPSSLWVLPALLLVGPLPVPRALTRTGFAALVALLTVMPWTIRNCQVMDGCAFVSTNGGWNLAIGALTETGRFTTLRADDGCPVVTGQVQQDRCWAEVGWNTIKADPRSWLKKIPKKLQQTYDHESFPIEYLREAAPDLWPEPRRKAGHEMLTLFHFLLMTAVAFSPITLVTSVRRRVSALTQGLLLLSTAAYASYCFASPEHPFYALMVMTPFIAFLPFPGRQSLGPAGRFLFVALFFTSLTHAVFFGEDRYHLVISPVLCILAAGALRTESQPAQWAQK
jgi:4-amino-4-deoxy-L-arabinose transferase-like glycosyltransferase